MVYINFYPIESFKQINEPHIHFSEQAMHFILELNVWYPEYVRTYSCYN
jgi:hypothetical protein